MVGVGQKSFVSRKVVVEWTGSSLDGIMKLFPSINQLFGVFLGVH